MTENKEAAGYTAEGRALEAQEIAGTDYPTTAPASDEARGAALEAQELNPAEPVAAPRDAYHATYGAPVAPMSGPAAAPAPAPAAAAQPAPHAPAMAAAPAKPKKPLDPERVFLICGMIAGAAIIVFGLCMLAYYTPAEVGEFFDTYKMNGSVGFSDVGATSQQILKGGFTLLLFAFGLTDICAFGAKYAKLRKDEK